MRPKSHRARLYMLALLTVVVTTIVFSLKHIPQSPAFHDFCDKLPFLGIPNFANIASNLVFLISGIAGFNLLRRSDAVLPIKVIYFFLFLGMVLTCIGSSYYHYSPDNDTLVPDRLPMTIVFMSLLAAVIAETIGPTAGAIALAPLLLIGTGSVLWWHYTEMAGAGDLRLYILVQYYPMILIPLLLLLFPNPTARRGWPSLVFAFFWYGAAKALEAFDCPIYTALHISGHTLKHLAAGLSTWMLVRRYRVMFT